MKLLIVLLELSKLGICKPKKSKGSKLKCDVTRSKASATSLNHIFQIRKYMRLHVKSLSRICFKFIYVLALYRKTQFKLVLTFKIRNYENTLDFK